MCDERFVLPVDMKISCQAESACFDIYNHTYILMNIMNEPVTGAGKAGLYANF
jgi:hypothetical protein